MLPSRSVTTASECPEARIGSSSAKCLRHVLICSLSLQVTIGELSEKVLTNISSYYLDSSPRHWPRLVHGCARWRGIVFASQRALRLRLLCTHRTPVLKTLNRWPSLPIIVKYGESPGLNSTPGEKHFSDLEDLVLSSRDSVRLTLPSTLWWGEGLRCLHLTKIAFPSLLQLLYSSRNLVDIHLHDVIYPWHFSLEALANALSGMGQLRSLSPHFLTTDSYLALPPTVRRTRSSPCSYPPQLSRTV